MPILKNSRHEKFALALFKGMSRQAALVEAGYKESKIRSTASRLATNSNILDRILELHQEAESDGIMTVRQRKERLSEIARANIPDFITEDGIKVAKDSPNVGAVSEITSVTKLFHKGSQPVVITKLKLHPSVPPIAELNKMGGDYAPVRMEHTGEKGQPIIVTVIEKVKDYGNKN